jgi:hypothetical protein
MEEEIKFEGDSFFVEKIIKNIEEISTKKGFLKKIDVESYVDKRIIEFYKKNEGFSIYIDFKEGDKAFFNLKGKEGIEIFFDALEKFFKDMIEDFKNFFDEEKIKKLKKIFEEILK